MVTAEEDVREAESGDALSKSIIKVAEEEMSSLAYVPLAVQYSIHKGGWLCLGLLSHSLPAP